MKKSNKSKAKEVKMTEQQFIAKHKKRGFELWKSSSVELKMNAFYEIQDVINRAIIQDK